MDVKEEVILGSNIGSHWYYISKAKALVKLLGEFESSKVLDVGAGSGYFSKYILANTHVSEACCVDVEYGRDEVKDEHGKKISFTSSVQKTDSKLVLMMDVLEHVDDEGLLIEYIKKVDSGTKFVISVPAFTFLWSDHDDYLEHKRRYTLKQLENVVVRSGLNVLHSSYYFAGVFPIAAFMRLAGKLGKKRRVKPKSHLKQHSVIVNYLLKTVSILECVFVPYNKLFGLTVFCVATKQ